MSEKVVFLADRFPELNQEGVTFCSCSVCRNKTFTLLYDNKQFPLLKCAACGQHIGRVGWAPED